MRALQNKYRKRFGYERSYPLKFVIGTKIAIVIPAYNELHIQQTLESLWACVLPAFKVAVVTVFNHPESADDQVKTINRRISEKTQDWFEKNNNDSIYGEVINAFNLPNKHAGVGLARKIGMDSSYHAFIDLNITGWIVCLDADCTVSKNYLSEQEKAFHENRRGAVCYFEHPLTNEGIVAYELYMRYYVQALKWTGYPYVSHTVGSTISVRSNVYASLGGMNKRQAGEDFYFLQKLLPGGMVKQIIETTVYPSSRESDRVSFGTGKEVANFEGSYPVPAVEVFEIVKDVVSALKNLNRSNYLQFELQIPVIDFFCLNNIKDVLREAYEHSSTDQTFQKRLFSWFDNLKVLQLIHYLETSIDRVEVEEACIQFLEISRINGNTESRDKLLTIFRKLDKQWAD